MKCQRCQAELLEGARFCARCGTAVSQPQPTAASVPQPHVGGAPESPGSTMRASQAGAPRAAATPDWWQDAKTAWARVGSAQLAAASVLSVLALILALVGLTMTLAAGETVDEYHGRIWLGFSGVLVFLSVGWFAAARSHAVAGVAWSAGGDLAVGAGLLGLALIFGLVALIVGLTEDLASQAGAAWDVYSGIWAICGLGWLLFTRPVEQRAGLGLAAGAGALGLLFAVIGLASGLGDQPDDIFDGAAWLGFAGLLAVVAMSAILGSRS